MAPDQKMVVLTKGCKLSKNQFGTINVFVLLFVEKMTFAVLLNERLCNFFLQKWPETFMVPNWFLDNLQPFVK